MSAPGRSINLPEPSELEVLREVIAECDCNHDLYCPLARGVTFTDEGEHVWATGAPSVPLPVELL